MKRTLSARQRRRLAAVVSSSALAAALLLTAALLRWQGLFRFSWEHPPPPAAIVAGDLFPGQGGAEYGHLPDMTPEQIMEQMQKAADAAYFSFKINARPIFEDGMSKGNLGIENPSYNIYPMVVQIFLDGTNELIYDSGGILPDQHIDNAELATALAAGTYNATAYLNAYDPGTQEFQGKQAATLVITVRG
ncbi:MAG: hypothetical protein LBJ84_06355 [Oscillospiraceae bacterium]|jgi:hypothetical protein|nr:hypothetical protein [Oscillospiraceae bacterium]